MQSENYYEEEYHLNRHNHLYKDEEYYFIRAKVALRLFFKGIKKSSKVLEYGCGLGQNIFLVNNSVGYDVSKFSLDFCRKKGVRTVDNLKHLERYGKFDVVLSCEVLEHLENPLEALKEMNLQLKERGKLVLILPIEKRKEPSHFYNYRPNLFDYNQHLYSWNFQSITNLLMRAGFYPIQYDVVRATGFRRLLWASRISFGLYFFLTKMAAIISGSKHMRIIAMKK